MPAQVPHARGEWVAAAAHTPVSPPVDRIVAELKTEASAGVVPIPADLAEMLKADAGETYIVPGVFGRGVTAWHLNEVWSTTRAKVDGLPDGFRIQDLRHYFASLLIAARLDIKVVQTRMRHATPMVTLRTYAHLWSDTDDTSRAAVGAVLEERRNSAT